MSNEESSVRVAVRIRPQTPGEVVEGCGVCARAGGAAGDGGVALGSERAFTFDFAFEPTATQQDIYHTCVSRLVEAALDGYNATVLAYGQTGSGKTYTMGSGWEGEGEGEDELRGIIPRAIRDLFAGADHRADEARAQGLLPPEFSVHAQFIELYNEDIVDLLDPTRDTYSKGGLKITEDGCGGVKIVGATVKAVRGARDALGVLRAGALARTTAATNMNSSSSRSHAVFTLMMRQRRLAADQDGIEKEDDTLEQYETLTAKFHFVDLAGSERLKRTGATGERAREGISINCGLLALGNVISALGDKSRKVLHVPYRDSKLTRLLQDSLGGNSNTVMIACVSPSDRDFMETLNTLKYANRARNIKNRCVVNQDLTSRTIHALRQELARLQIELTEYKQGKRIVSENGEEGWSDVVQENAILTGEVESLRRRVKAMQGTIEQLSTKNSELIAEKALGAWAPKDGSPDTSECNLTTLIQGYVREIEELRAQLLESNALYEASRKREQIAARARHDSSIHDTASVIDDAKRELYKEKELLARSMGELEFSRKAASMVDSVTSSGGDTMGERERAEGESADDSDLSDRDDDSEEEDKAQMALSEELAALSGDIDTKQRLIEELELSQKRLAALKTHYEQRLDTLHSQIKATQHERDKVLATLGTQSSQPSDKLKRVKDDYERRLAGMARELKRLQNAQKEHSRLQRSQQHTDTQIQTLRTELNDMKRDKVKLVQRMRTESKRHAAAEAARAKEVAQLRKESRKNANLIRSLEAEKRLKEQVLRRKQEEVSLLRRGHRDKLSSKAAGRLHERVRKDEEEACRSAWSRLERWLRRGTAARGLQAELERQLERALEERERVRRHLATALHTDQAHHDHLRYLHHAVADAQQQIMQLEEENEESELPQVLEQIKSVESGRYALQRLAALALSMAHDAARDRDLLAHTRAQLRELEETTVRRENLMRAAEDHNLNVWTSPPNLSSLLAHVSSGTSTRSVSPVDSALLEVRPMPDGVRESVTAPASPSGQPNNSPFVRNIARRGSVRLRDLGVYGREAHGDGDVMTQSMVEPARAPPPPPPLARVPSAPGSLRGLTPLGGIISTILTSPLTPRRPTPESPRLPRRQLERQQSIHKPNYESTPPASPGAARRQRDDDVFLRLAGAAAADNAPPKGVVKEFPLKRVNGGGGVANAWLQCTHVAEGHAGAVLALAVSPNALYSGGVDRTVRGWDLRGGAESWRGWCGAPVTSLAARPDRLLLAAAGAAARLYDTRTRAPLATLWSSGVSGATAPARGPAGEVAITALALSSDSPRLYTASGDKLRLWDLRMQECVTKVWSGHAAAVMCLALGRAGGGDLLCTGSKDHYVRTLEMQPQEETWDVGARRLLEPPHYDGVQALALDGDFLYSASRDMSIKRWSLKDNVLTHSVMNAHKGWATGVSACGGRVASCGRDGVLRLWRLTEGGGGGTGGGTLGGTGGALVAAARAALPDAAHALAAHPHLDTLYTAGNGGDVRAWRLVGEM